MWYVHALAEGFDREPTLCSQVYDPSIISPLVATLRLALVGPGKSAIVALTERNENTLAQFVKAASALFFHLLALLATN